MNNDLVKTLRIKSLNHLSLRLGVDEAVLNNLSASVINYKHGFVTKRAGGKRLVSFPTNRVVISIQKKVFKLLDQVEQSQYAYGSIKGGSVDACLLPHVAKKYFYLADIKSFFPSIKHTYVYAIFSRFLECSPNVARVLTLFSTTNFNVPQGVRQSPIIANLILKDFDYKVANFCHKQGAFYSRYVDNLLISSDTPIRGLRPFLRQSVSMRGFSLKRGEPKLFKGEDNLVILGRIIKDKMGLPNDYRNNLRALIYNCVVNSPSHQNRYNKKNFKLSLESKIKLVQRFYPGEAKRLLRMFENINWS